MNIIFCTSPFQVLIAREIVKTIKEKFIGIYLKMSHDRRQDIYAAKMMEFCEDTLFIENKNWVSELRKKLEKVKIEKFYLASLDNPIALSILSFESMQLFTFDDGSTAVIAPNMYTANKQRIVSHNGMTLENVVNLSQGHYTIFDSNTVFPDSKLIKIDFNIQPEDFIRANNGKTVRVFLGQALGSCFDEKDIVITKELTKKALVSLGDVLYSPHPRVSLELENVNNVNTDVCFEEDIYKLLTEYEYVEVYGFYSTSLILVKDIPGVSVKGFRTFLTTNESQVLNDFGIEYIDLPISDRKVDIIIPVHNAQATVASAVESVLNQVHNNFRLIIVDGDSTDDTELICRKYLEDSRVNYHKIESGGIFKALDAGIFLSTAEYIARLDTTNEWLPWHLDFLLSELELNPRLDVIGSKVIEGDCVGGIRRSVSNNLSGEKLWLMLAYKNIFNNSAVVFRKKAYEQAGRYDFNSCGFEDWHLWARMVTKNNALVLGTVTVFCKISDEYDREMLFRSRLARSRGLRLQDVLE